MYMSTIINNIFLIPLVFMGRALFTIGIFLQYGPSSSLDAWVSTQPQNIF